ncbi:hypothetical protein VTN02DRAFT_4920 [Thermoascus thermophilus]
MGIRSSSASGVMCLKLVVCVRGVLYYQHWDCEFKAFLFLFVFLSCIFLVPRLLFIPFFSCRAIPCWRYPLLFEFPYVSSSFTCISHMHTYPFCMDSVDWVGDNGGFHILKLKTDIHAVALVRETPHTSAFMVAKVDLHGRGYHLTLLGETSSSLAAGRCHPACYSVDAE